MSEKAHVVEEGLETEAATGARVGQAEQEARTGPAGQEQTLWAPRNGAGYLSSPERSGL